MSPEPVIFDLRLSVVPLWNVRIEFNRTLTILNGPDFRAQVEQYARAGKPEPLFAHHILWGGPPEGLLTWFLQRTIIGIEAYLPSALFIAAVNYRRVTEAIFRAKNDPFDVDAKRTTTADRLYNKLPGLLHQNYQLNRVNGALWKSVREFYDAVRNPLFHGYQLDTAGRRRLDTLDAVLRAYDMFVQI